MTQKKVCMLGAFAVGKTSLVQQFVYSKFSDRYHTTIGVKVDRKDVEHDGQTTRLLLWDLAGEDEFHQVNLKYLRGSAALFFVVDGTRRETVDAVARLHERTIDAIGHVPGLVALNKSDLTAGWEIDDGANQVLSGLGLHVLTTSAKTGQSVNAAFEWIARRVVQPA